METPTGKQKSLGQAIDELIQALEPLDETSRVTAIRAACEHLKIAFSSDAKPVAMLTQTPAHTSDAPASQPLRVADIQTLRVERQPTSASEMAALVAYYLAELAGPSERTAEVTVEDVLKYFKQARYPLPKARAMLLPNAKNAGYFDSLGDGKYRLNPVGYNLVAHNLPRSGTDARTAKSRKQPSKAAKRAKRKQ